MSDSAGLTVIDGKATLVAQKIDGVRGCCGCQTGRQTMTMHISKIWRAVTRSVLAPECLLCGAAAGDAMLCEACAAALPQPPPACPVCAAPSPGAAVCGACLSRPPSFDATFAVWPYGFPIDRLVQSLKYRGNLPVARMFGAALALRVAGRTVDVDAPMPLARERLTARGFNQAMEIARATVARSALVNAKIERVRDTASQTDLPYVERARNVRGAFACGGTLRGLRVAVVDDVMTSGATLDELAETLKRAGAAWVENWVIARTLPRDV
jgi:ComF family protein